MPNVRNNSSRGRGRPSRSEVLSREVEEREATFVTMAKACDDRERLMILMKVEADNVLDHVMAEFKGNAESGGVVEHWYLKAMMKKFVEVDRQLEVEKGLYETALKSKLVAYQSLEKKRSELAEHLIQSAQS